MSWNAHTDHIFNQVSGQLSYLCLSGPDGSKWGESGQAKGSSALKAPDAGTSFVCEGVKYMFLRSIDNFSCYNNKGQGLAIYKGTQYHAFAFAAQGYKAEQCVDALEKLKSYLSGIGYN